MSSRLSECVSRRRFVLGALGLGLAGCGDAPILQSATESLRLAVTGAPDVPLTRERVDALPYASVRVKVGKGPRALLVLGRYAGDELHWISADRAVIATRHGRVVRTFGFATNLSETRDVTPDPLAGAPQSLATPVEYARLIDLGPSGPYQVLVRSTVQALQEEGLEILDRHYATVRIDEHGSAPSVSWSFQNTYWVDISSGLAWRSIQRPAPGIGPIEIDILKPARPA